MILWIQSASRAAEDRNRTWHKSFVLALARTTKERLLARVLTDTGAETTVVFVAKDIMVSRLSLSGDCDQNYRNE